MNGFLLVSLGGALGAAARYGVGLMAASRLGSASGLYATFFVNLIGSALMGALMAWLITREQDAETRALFLALGVGLLGGFTTFSAFSLEVVHMLNAGASFRALAYVTASVVGGVVALMVAFAFIKRVLA